MNNTKKFDKTENRKFRGIWIPSTIWLNDQLNTAHKLMLAEIDSLSGDGECFASNAYFAEFFGWSKRYVAKIISELNGMNLITVRMTYKKDSKEVERRFIRCVGYDAPIEMNVTVVEKEKLKPDVKNEVVEIINHLNNVTGSSFRHQTESTRKHINARLNEGFTVNDIKMVINDRSAYWKNDPKMAEYLRPSTLFAGKFESYFNAAKTRPAPQSHRPPTSIDHGSLFGERSNGAK